MTTLIPCGYPEPDLAWNEEVTGIVYTEDGPCRVVETTREMFIYDQTLCGVGKQDWLIDEMVAAWIDETE